MIFTCDNLIVFLNAIKLLNFAKVIAEFFTICFYNLVAPNTEKVNTQKYVLIDIFIYIYINNFTHQNLSVDMAYDHI